MYLQLERLVLQQHLHCLLLRLPVLQQVAREMNGARFPAPHTSGPRGGMSRAGSALATQVLWWALPRTPAVHARAHRPGRPREVRRTAGQ